MIEGKHPTLLDRDHPGAAIQILLLRARLTKGMRFHVMWEPMGRAGQ